MDRTVQQQQQQQQQPQPPPQQQQQQGLPIEKKAPAPEVGGARKAASGREPEPESEMALRHQTARREAVEQDHTVLTAVTSVRSPGEGGGGGAGAGSGPVDSTHGGSGMPPVGEAGSLTGGGAAIVSSETHARLREHTGGTEGTTAAGVNDDPSTQRGEPAFFEEAITSGGYTRPELELCAPLQLHVASEAAALALIDAGATCISMLQPPRSYRVMSAGLFETVVPAIRTTLGQGADGRQHPDAVRLLTLTSPHLLPPAASTCCSILFCWFFSVFVSPDHHRRVCIECLLLYARVLYSLTPLSCCGLCSGLACCCCCI